MLRNFLLLFGNKPVTEYNAVCPAITPTVGPTEILSDNGMDNAGSWNIGAGWAVGSGVATGTAASSLLRQAGVLTANNWYQVTWDIVSRTGGAVAGYPGIGGNQVSAPATYITTGQASNANAGVNGNAFSGVVDNIFCKLIAFSTMLSFLISRSLKNGTYICHPTIALDSQCGMVIEYIDANNLVMFNVNLSDGKAHLKSCIAGVWAEPIATAVAYGAGKELKLIVSGTTHKLYYDGTQVSTDKTIDNSSMGTKVYGFNSLVGNTVGAVTTNP
jgi:hypothetical protein